MFLMRNLFIVLFFLAAGCTLQAQNRKIEFAIHGSLWTADPLTDIFNEELDDFFAGPVQQAAADVLAENGFMVDKSELSFISDFDYESEGDLIGASIRYLPNGNHSKITLALSVDKVNLKIRGLKNYQEQIMGADIEAIVFGELELNPWVVSLQSQFFFGAENKLSPYITLGAGFGYLEKKDEEINSYTIISEANISVFGLDVTLPYTRKYSIQEAEDEGASELSKFMPLAQIAFGVRASVTRRLSSYLEGGIWNGLYGRISIGYSF